MGSPLAFISEGIGEGVAKTMTARKAPAGERSENAMDVAAARLLAADIGNRRRTGKAWRQLRGGGMLSPQGFKSRHIPATAAHL